MSGGISAFSFEGSSVFKRVDRDGWRAGAEQRDAADEGKRRQRSATSGFSLVVVNAIFFSAIDLTEASLRWRISRLVYREQLEVGKRSVWMGSGEWW